MDLKKLDKRISFLSRAAKKKLLEKFLVLTNDNFLWLNPTQKEISNIDELSEISSQEDLARWAELFEQTRKGGIRTFKASRKSERD